jgi:hypothetical protein
MFLYALVIYQPANSVSTLQVRPPRIFVQQARLKAAFLQYAIIPGAIGYMGLIYLVSFKIKNETHHQIMWCITFILQASMLTANTLAWKDSGSPDIASALRGVPCISELGCSDPAAKGIFSELGWFVTVL